MDPLDLQKDAHLFRLGYLTAKIVPIFDRPSLSESNRRLLQSAKKLLTDIKGGREFIVSFSSNFEADTLSKVEIYSFFVENIKELVGNGDLDKFIETVDQSEEFLGSLLEGKELENKQLGVLKKTFSQMSKVLVETARIADAHVEKRVWIE